MDRMAPQPQPRDRPDRQPPQERPAQSPQERPAQSPRERPDQPPRMVSAAERAIEAAMARGDFDDLALAGKPLRLPAHDGPDWWIRERISRGDVDRDALLPPVVLLRREADALDDTLRELRDEDAVRAYAEDYTARVLADRAANPSARLLAPTLDPELAARRWARLRAHREGGPSQRPGSV